MDDLPAPRWTAWEDSTQVVFYLLHTKDSKIGRGILTSWNDR